MKDFRVKNVVDDVMKQLPVYVPRFVVSYVIRYFFRRVYGILALRTNARFIFYKCELNQIYPDIRENEEMRKFFDLDETKEFSINQVKILNDLERYEAQKVYNKKRFSNNDPRIRVRRRNRHRLHSPECIDPVNQDVSQP